MLSEHGPFAGLPVYPPGWTEQLLETVADINPETLRTTTPPSLRFRYLDIGSVHSGAIDWSTINERIFSSAPSRARRVVRPGDVLLCTVRPALQAHAFAGSPQADGLICSTGFAVIRARKGMVPRYLYHLIFSDAVSKQLRRLETGSNYPAVNETDIRLLHIPRAPEVEEHHIAAILDTIDAAIQRTEALITKLKHMKAGLLHDLLTSGIDESGEVRDISDDREQFKDSPLGLIPRTWEIRHLRDLVESAVDGPFGSNLKTEHYVTAPGVRVVRLQNIGPGYFDDSDKAYISHNHANRLQRHQVLPGDLLIASLGDDNHPLARACLYPSHLESGIVKADGRESRQAVGRVTELGGTPGDRVTRK